MADLPQGFRSTTVRMQEVDLTPRVQTQVPSNQQMVQQPASIEDQVVKQLFDTVFKESAPSDLSKLHEIYADKIQNAINVVQREADLKKAVEEATKKEIEARIRNTKALQEEMRQQRRKSMGAWDKTKDTVSSFWNKLGDNKINDMLKKASGITGNQNVKNVLTSFQSGDLKGLLGNTKTLIGTGTKLASVGAGIITVAQLVVNALDNYAALVKRNVETSSAEAFLNKGPAYAAKEQAEYQKAARKSSIKFAGDEAAWEALNPKLAQNFSKTYLDELNRGTYGFRKQDLMDNLLAVGKSAELRGGNAEQAQSLMMDVQRMYGSDPQMSANAVDKFYRNIEKKFDKLPTSKVSDELIKLWDSTKQYGVGLDSVVDATSKYTKELNTGILKWQDFGSANRAQEGASIEDLFKQVSVLSQSGMLSDIGSVLGKDYANLSIDQIVAKVLTDPKMNQYVLGKKADWVDRMTPAGEGSIIANASLSNGIMGMGATNKQTAFGFEKGSIRDSGAILAAGSDASAGRDLTGEARKKATEDLEKSKDTVAKVINEMVGPTQRFSNSVKEATKNLKDFTGVLGGALKESPAAQTTWNAASKAIIFALDPFGIGRSILK